MWHVKESWRDIRQYMHQSQLGGCVHKYQLKSQAMFEFLSVKLKMAFIYVIERFELLTYRKHFNNTSPLCLTSPIQTFPRSAVASVE